MKKEVEKDIYTISAMPKVIADMKIADLSIATWKLPNKFWRIMQYLILGIKYERRK